MTCEALLVTYLMGVRLADLDKSRVYEVPESMIVGLTMGQRAYARGCAIRLGIKYKVVAR